MGKTGYVVITKSNHNENERRGKRPAYSSGKIVCDSCIYYTQRVEYQIRTNARRVFIVNLVQFFTVIEDFVVNMHSKRSSGICSNVE